jgi:threonyl-tRNA synthetase
MPVVTLPDGSTRSYEAPVSVMHVAADIGAGLAKATLAGRVDGELVDASFIIQNDASLAIVTSRDADALELFRHNGTGGARAFSGYPGDNRSGY